MRQIAHITAKNEAEYHMRINELLKRGFEIQKEFPPEESEHRHYTYQQTPRSVNKTHKETDFRKKYRATMVRHVG